MRTLGSCQWMGKREAICSQRHQSPRLGDIKLVQGQQRSQLRLFPCRTSRREPVLNDDILSRITCGVVLIKPSVKEFRETSVLFQDGTVQDDLDAVIFATGYSHSFPFMEDKSIIKSREHEISLYKCIVPPQLEKPTMAVIGMVQSFGSAIPTADVQCRWAVKVFQGR